LRCFAYFLALNYTNISLITYYKRLCSFSADPKLESKFEIAKNAKQIGLKTEDIIKLTGLTKEEIEKL
jgi:hypothetical protein